LVNRLGRLAVSAALGASIAALLWLGTIAITLLDNVVPAWPFVIIAACVAASLFIVDVLTEEKK
jgi:hypothetical protein